MVEVYFGLHDMAIGPVACGGRAALKALLLNGRPIVEDDAIPGLDLDAMRHDALAAVAHQRLFFQFL